MHNEKKLLFKREYIPIVICAVILIFLITALILLFSTDKIDKKLPPLKKFSEVEVKVSDFEDGVAKVDDLLSYKKENLKTNFKILSNFRSAGIILKHYEVIMNEDDYIFYSVEGSEQTYIAKVSSSGHLDFSLKFSKKIDKKKYSIIDISKVLVKNKKYYVFLNGYTNDEEIDSIVITLNDKGNMETSKIIATGDKKIVDSYFINEEIAVIRASNSLDINYLNDSLEDSGVYKMDNDSNNPFASTNIVYRDSILNDNKITILLSRGAAFSEVNYKYYVTVTKQENNAIWTPTNSETESDEFPNDDGIIETNDTNYKGSRLINNNIIYLFDEEIKVYNYQDSLLNSINYKEMNTGMLIDSESNAHNDGEQTEPQNDYLTIVGLYNNNVLLLKNTKEYVIDILNDNLKPIKRYQLPLEKLQVKNAGIKNIFYKDNKLTVVSDYGEDTSAILLYTIGG